MVAVDKNQAKTAETRQVDPCIRQHSGAHVRRGIAVLQGLQAGIFPLFSLARRAGRCAPSAAGRRAG